MISFKFLWPPKFCMVVLTAPKWLKLQTSYLMCMFRGTVQTWPFRNFSRGRVVRIKWLPKIYLTDICSMFLSANITQLFLAHKTCVHMIKIARFGQSVVFRLTLLYLLSVMFVVHGCCNWNKKHAGVFVKFWFFVWIIRHDQCRKYSWFY